MSTSLANPFIGEPPAGVSTFVALSDTPVDYTAGALWLARINAGQTALEFVDPASVGVTDHGALGGLGDDDHINYAYLPGRAGGQTLNGGTLASQELILRGTVNANLGLIRARSPIVFDDVTPGNALSPYSIADTSTQAFTAGFVGGIFNASPTITFTNAFFIWEALRGSPNIQSLVNPGFAAFTLFQALPQLRSGPGATNHPLQGFVLNAGISTLNEYSGSRTSPGSLGMSWSPQTKTTVSGAVLTVSVQTAVRCSPTFSTVAGSTINMGTIRGVHCLPPAAGLFQPSTGVENLANYYGISFNNITNVTSGDKAVVHSIMTDAADRFFLLNPGGARSDFGGGNLLDCGFVQCLADSVGLSLGAAGGDVVINWNGTALEWDPLSGLDARWRPFTNYWHYTASAASGLQLDIDAISFGTTTPDLTGNWFCIFAAPNLRQPQVNGQYADVLWTAGGTIDVNGLTISDLSAFQINAVSTILNGGTIADSSTLFVNAMASVNATRLQALRVLGRWRMDGIACHNSAALTQLTANVTQLTLPANNGGRFVLLQDADASGPWTIRGILNVQVGDAFYIVNDGANAFILGHQDGTAAAVDRIISPTGANLTIGPDEMAKLWYDSTASRWRILETTGA